MAESTEFRVKYSKTVIKSANVLVYLFKNDGSTVTEIARDLAISRGAVLRTLNAFVEAGLVSVTHRTSNSLSRGFYRLAGDVFVRHPPVIFSSPGKEQIYYSSSLQQDQP